MQRLLVVAVPAMGLVGLVFLIGVGVPWFETNQPNPVPTQPIYFNHQVHAQLANIDCAFCHRTAAQGVSAGLPELQQCMFCHQVIAGEPEIEKVRQAWVAQQSIEWVRVHRLPDHSRFPHNVHVQAGLDCATCHGDVSRMGQVVQVRPLRMNDCVNCHRQTGALAQCGACHY